MNVVVARPSSRKWRLAAVFALALIVRLVYNLYIAGHRILDVGDSFYYLTAGRALARLVRESQSIQIFFTQLCAAAQYAPGSFNSFSSLGLSDRLLIDGPIYPSYLAAIFLLTGKALETTALNINQVVFALANSVTDSLLAVVVAFLAEISFGGAAAMVAGVLWCLYLPAVINTQQCYGEPVVALILTGFLAAMLYQSNRTGANLDASGKAKPQYLASLITGLLAGLVMLAKPAFVLLPPLMLALHLIALAYSGRLRGQRYSAAALVLGIILALTPWLLYTSTVSGAPRLIVNRAPGYNLYIGNYLPTDGWKTWPVVDGVPDAIADAKRFIESEAERQPAQLLSLTLRKIPRLWAGVWNDFHIGAFGIAYRAQNCLQMLLLLWATLGLASQVRGRLRGGRTTAFASAMTLAYGVAFHFIYVLFEPVPRYAFTAMPLVIVLAAVGLVAFTERLGAISKRARILTLFKLLILTIVVALIAACANTTITPVGFLTSVITDSTSLRMIGAIVSVISLLAIGCAFGFISIRLKLSGPIRLLVVGKTFILAALIAAAGALSDPAYLEYGEEIGGAKGTLITDLTLPDLGKNLPPMLYVLMDVQSTKGAPHLVLNVNGHAVNCQAMPLYELTAGAADIPTLIALQSRMMDVDYRTFRQWWYCPVPTEYFKFNAVNQIELAAQGWPGLKVFGDYQNPRPDTAGGENCVMPSLNTFSWSKGFLTADCRDPRVYEETYFRGTVGAARTVNRDDGTISTLAGHLRVRVAVPMGTTAAENLSVSKPLTLYENLAETEISGLNPILFDSKLLTVDKPITRGSILHLSMEARRRDPRVPATMALALDNNTTKSPYVPVWQPSCIRIGERWESFDFQTILPSSAADWQKLGAHLMFSPFPGDKLYLHRKEALRDSIFVRRLRLEILPPPVPGATGALKLI